MSNLKLVSGVKHSELDGENLTIWATSGAVFTVHTQADPASILRTCAERGVVVEHGEPAEAAAEAEAPTTAETGDAPAKAPRRNKK